MEPGWTKEQRTPQFSCGQDVSIHVSLFSLRSRMFSAKLAVPRGLWDLNSSTSDWTQATAVKVQNPYH